MRVAERVFLVYYVYVALIALLLKPQAAVVAIVVAVGLGGLMAAIARLARTNVFFERARDWLPILYTLIAYREMNWFTPDVRDYHLEKSWIVWDHVFLDGWGARNAIESLGWLGSGYLEFCYLLVYGITAASIASFYFYDRRDRIDHFFTVYAIGTLLTYALFPYFPSDPPRVVFAGADQPGVTIVIRDFNLYLVGNYGIHSSVFPSAHVSSAFAAGWGLLLFLREKPWIGRGMLIYAASVSVATIYGRYHYAVDAVAGVAVGLIALAAGTKVRANSYSESE